MNSVSIAPDSTRSTSPSSSIVTRVTWLTFTLVCVSPVVAWFASVNDPFAYFRTGLPAGQQMYLVAKLSGLLAMFVFWLQAMLALARRAPILVGFPSSGPRLHKLLGIATVMLIFAHVGLFVAAASTRSDQIAWDLLWPDFTHGYYRTHIGLGAVALWMTPLMLFAGWRLSRGRRAWKVVHMVWPIAFVLVFLHAYGIGTESRFGAMRYVVLFVIASLAIALFHRLYRRKRSDQGSSPPPNAQTEVVSD
jgi:predicted ferric reductase